MGLRDEAVEAAARHRAYQRCGVHLACQRLPADEARELRELVADHSIPTPIISDVLAKRGIDLGGDAIRRSRNGRCKCCRADA